MVACRAELPGLIQTKSAVADDEETILDYRAVSPFDGVLQNVSRIREHPQFKDSWIVESKLDGLQWTEPMPSDETLSNLYASAYNGMFGRDFSEGAILPEFVVRRARAQLDFILASAPGGTFPDDAAEVGAGWGALACEVVKRNSGVGKETRYKCYDADPAAVDFIRRRGISAEVGVTLDEASGVGAGSLGAILASHVFEHMNRPSEALESYLRLLRPGGLLFLEVPLENPSPAWWGTDPAKPYWVGHLTFFNRHHIEGLAARAGFEVLAVAGHDHPASAGVVHAHERPYAVETVPEEMDSAPSTSASPRFLRILLQKPAKD